MSSFIAFCILLSNPCFSLNHITLFSHLSPPLTRAVSPLMSEETVHSFCSLSLLQSFPFLTTLPRAELCTLFFPFSLQLLPNLPALNDLLCNCMSDFPLDWSSLWAGPLSIIQCIPIGCQEKAPFCDICLCVLQSCCKIGFYKPQEFFSVHFFL